MATIWAKAYATLIPLGLRKIEDVKPKELQDEVVGLLREEGLDRNGKPLEEDKEEPVEPTEPIEAEEKEEDKAEDGGDVGEPGKEDDKPVEDKEDKEAR